MFSGTSAAALVSGCYVENYLSWLPIEEAAVVMRYALALAAFLAFSTNNLTGVWTGEMKDAEGGSGGAYLQLTQDGVHITGSTGASKDHAWPIKNAIFADDHLTFHVTSTDPESKEKSEWTFDLKVDGDRMTGTAEGRQEDRSWKAELQLTREK
jgi:hypothetical protein